MRTARMEQPKFARRAQDVLRRVAAVSLAGASALLVVGPAAPASGDPVPPAAPPADWTATAVRIEPGAPGVLDLGEVGRYRGSLHVVAGGGGLTVVNDVAFDDYLRGIVEVPATWPREALEAQAIAARTYALWQMWSDSPSAWRAAGADICATEACQVYRGVDGEHREGGLRWARAVAETAGLVLLQDGGVIKSMYSASNGGVAVGSGGAVADPDDASISPFTQWRAVLPTDQLVAALGVEGAVRVVEAANTEGLVRLTFERADGSRVGFEAPPDRFRSTVNARVEGVAGVPRPLPSPFFTLAVAPEGVVAEGSGFGHGRGLSQYGALAKAQRGQSAEQILGAYYSGLSPTEVAPEALPPRIKVAVAEGREEVTVHAEQPVTVLDAAGQPLAYEAAGELRLVADGDQLVVVPPAGQAEPLRATVTPVSGTRVPLGGTFPVRFELSHPSVVETELVGPDGSSQPLGDGLLPAGPKEQEVTAPAVPGLHRVVARVDAGAGRTATLQLGFVVVDPEAAAAVRSAPDEPVGAALVAATAVAVVLLTIDVLVLVTRRTLGFRRRPT